MTLRGPTPLAAVLVLLAAATWVNAGDEDEPRLKDRVVLNNRVRCYTCDHLEFSRDGRTLFSFGGPDGKVRVWDVASEKQIASLRQDFREVVEFAYSPDGKLIATASRRRGDICIWDAKTFKKVRVFEGKEYAARLIFGPDSETVSLVAEGTLYGYRVKDGILFHSCTVDPVRGSDRVRPVACSGPVKKPMLVCGNRLFDAVTGHECYRLTVGKFCPGCTGPPAAITSDGKKMADGGPFYIAIWNLTKENEDPARRERLDFNHPKVLVRCLSFSPNNQILAVGYVEANRYGGVGNRNNSGILFFDAGSGKLLYNQDARIADVCSLAFSPDGRLLASGDYDGVLKLWDVPAAWCKKAR